MSLGSTEPYDRTDIESVAVNQLTAETGTLFVIAAGNSGCEGCIGTPGAADAAITVGAVDGNDQLADFSSKGPRYGVYGLKPDVVAPGVGILAAKMGGDADSGWYQEMDGTSMATPHVAGVAALLLQEHPDWKAPQVKDAIMSTALPLPDYTAYQVGAGRVSVPAAVAATVTATGSQYFGIFAWPHAGDADVDRTVTWTNTGDTDVTLHLTESAREAGGPYDATADDPAPPVGEAARTACSPWPATP
jgi:subtilisin family serine protease